jgi:hypothetical protein
VTSLFPQKPLFKHGTPVAAAFAANDFAVAAVAHMAGLTHDLPLGITGHLFKGPVDEHDHPLFVHDHDPVLNRIDHDFPVMIHCHPRWGSNCSIVKFIDVNILNMFATIGQAKILPAHPNPDPLFGRPIA